MSFGDFFTKDRVQFFQIFEKVGLKFSSIIALLERKLGALPLSVLDIFVYRRHFKNVGVGKS